VDAYFDCIVFSSTYIGVEPRIFQDGFGSGSFSAWTGRVMTSGETASISSTRVHHGAYSAKFASNGGGGYERAYAYKSITRDYLYVRGYFYVSQSGLVDNGDSVYFIVLRSGSDNVALAGWKIVNGAIGWCLTVKEDLGYVDLSGVNAPDPSLPPPPATSLNRWFCVELYWHRGVSPAEGGPEGFSGHADLYVDGKWAASDMRYMASIIHYNPVTSVRIGIGEAYGLGATTVYADCCAVDRTLVRMEP
jgi:hypothetical protein